MNKKISVLMPSLNVVKYLKECLNSVIGQTYSNLEIIIVDAGSSDGTLEILDYYARKDPRIRVIHSDKKSYGYQMNMALHHASGEYVGIVETDDYIANDMYETLLVVAQENNAEYVKGNVRFIRTSEDGKSHIVKEVFYPKEQGFVNQVINPSKMPELLLNDIYHWNGLYRKDFLENIYFNETDGAAFQDQGFLLQTMSKAHRVVYIEQPVYFYRQNNANSSIYNTKGFRYIYQEYTLNYKYLERLDNKWINVFFIRMLDQIYGRYYVMSISNFFWEDAREDIKTLRNWIINAIERGYLIESQMGKERRKKLACFLKGDIDLYDYTKAPFLYDKKMYFKRISECNHIWIYGAGKIGNRVLQSFYGTSYKNKLQGFVVSEKGSQSDVEGYPVKELSEITDDDAVFIIALSVKYHSEVQKRLEEKGIFDYIVWNEKFVFV